MSLKQSYYRYRITFAKVGAVRFIGHLDLQSLFQRAIKRAKLPVAYSEGFNPHQLLSFAAPLPLGMAGYAEVLEVFLMREVPAVEIADSLNSQLPLGLEVNDVQEVPAIGKSAAALVRRATYSIAFLETFDLDRAVKEALKSQGIEIEKKGKKGMNVVDIRPDIYGLEVTSPGKLHAVLACGSERNLKPEVLMKYILKVLEIEPDDCDIVYERLEIELKEAAAT